MPEMRLPMVRTLWFAASVSSSLWYLCWISYDVLVWNKQLAQVRQLNLAGLMLSVAFIFVGIGLNKIFHFEKPVSPIKPVQQKAEVLQTGRPVLGPAPVQQVRESQPIQPAKEGQKQTRRDASILPNCGFYLGYLHERPKSEDIPSECLSCMMVVNCISPTIT